MSEEPAIREPISNAEFCRFVAEAQEQRARADAAEAQAARLMAALEDVTYYLAHLARYSEERIPASDMSLADAAVRRARAALAPGEPSAEPGVLRSAACAQHGARLCATCAGFEGGSPYAEPSTEERATMTELVEYAAADQIRRLLDNDDRFSGVSGATAFRHEDRRRKWTDAGYFSFERGGRLYFVTVDLAK